MLNLAAIHRPIADLLAGQLEEVSHVFERQLASELSSVNRLCLHIERYRGKMLRPTLVLLSGLIEADERDLASALAPQHQIIAAVTEMIHMATLVHDDVLDEADERRRGATVNAVWGNETAVMLGDYLISNAFHLCSTAVDPAINLSLGEVTNTLCEGELMQIHHREDFSVDEETYFAIIRRKTASLIAEACRLGAYLSGCDDETVSRPLHKYGLDLGVAFQIQDDLLDLVGDQQRVGNTLGKDIDKGKLTLPVIHHLATADPIERGRSLELLEANDIDALRGRMIDSESIRYAQSIARSFVDHARARLAPMRETPARNLLLELAEQVITRTF